MEIVELGCAGHLIMADRCRFRRHTQIGDKYRVSTVGDYFPASRRETIGSGKRDYFETRVFETGGLAPNNEGCGCHSVLDYCGVASDRYATAGEAQRGHEAMVRKYAALARGDRHEPS